MDTWLVVRNNDGSTTVIFDDGAFDIPATLNTGNNADQPKGATS